MYRAIGQRAPLRAHRRNRLGKKYGRGAAPRARRAGDRRGRARARGGRSRGPRGYAPSWRPSARACSTRAGALDRKALARIAFSDDAARRRLNAITHPRIARRTAERAAELARAGEPLGCYEAALLVENGVADMFRPLVVVSCPEAVQIERIRSRDESSRDGRAGAHRARRSRSRRRSPRRTS